MNHLSGKRVLVTGSAGTVGRYLVQHLVGGGYEPQEVVCIDNSESELFFQEQRYLDEERVHFSLADVRDMDAMRHLMRGIDVVIHCAAYKHVVMCERSPMDAVQTNIHGTQNVITAATENKVERVLFTSSDKAVNPTNVMGTSKLMGERLVTAANSRFRGDGTLFSSTRFGNVMGSRGSVIPIFMEQIRRGGPVSLTDERMTRFIMSIKESARLVLDSVDLMCGGEVFITKMPIVRIDDLAHVMIDTLAPQFGHDPGSIEIKVIGSKPGEKLYEELMSLEETRRAMELSRYFAITPAFTGIYRDIAYDYPDLVSSRVELPYISERGPFMSREALKDFLVQNDLLSVERGETEGSGPREHAQRYWPGDKQRGAAGPKKSGKTKG